MVLKQPSQRQPRKPIVPVTALADDLAKLNKEQSRLAMDEILRLDPAWRFYRTFATDNQRAVIESTALYLHIDKPNQVGGTATMLVDAALYLRGIHPTRPRPKEPLQILFIVPRKAQMGSIFGKRLFKASSIVTNHPAYAHLLAKEPDLALLGSIPLICKEEDAHLEKTGSSMGRVVSKATIPGPYGSDELFFFISGDDKAWETVMGNNYHAVYRDESVAKGQNLMPELRMRVAIHHDRHTVDRPGCGYIRWGCTTLKFSEELREFVKFCTAGVEGHAQIRLTKDDNPTISAAARASLAIGMSDSEANKRIWGTATAMDEDLILRVERDRVLRFTPYQVLPEDNLWLAYDPGFRDPCAICLFAVPKGTQRLIMLAYRSWAYGTTHEHVACMASLLNGRLAVSIVCDPAIKRSDSITGVSNYDIFCQAVLTAGIRLNSAPCLGRNRYEDTVPLLQTFLSHQENRELCFDCDGDGTEEALCQFETFRYKEGATRKLMEANVYQKNNQSVDATRYLCSRFNAWIDLGPNTSKETERAEAAVEAAVNPALATHRRWLEDGAMGFDAWMAENPAPAGGGSLSFASVDW